MRAQHAAQRSAVPHGAGDRRGAAPEHIGIAFATEHGTGGQLPVGNPGKRHGIAKGG